LKAPDLDELSNQEPMDERDDQEKSLQEALGSIASQQPTNLIQTFDNIDQDNSSLAQHPTGSHHLSNHHIPNIQSAAFAP